MMANDFGNYLSLRVTIFSTLEAILPPVTYEVPSPRRGIRKGRGDENGTETHNIRAPGINIALWTVVWVAILTTGVLRYLSFVVKSEASDLLSYE